MPRILIVDDDRDLLEVVSSLLARKGFEVESNINWDEANKKIEEFQPQVILLDVFLSGIDGLEICKKLKEDPMTSHIPIIIFSGYPRVAETVMYEYGADDFITKPFEVEEMIEKIHNVLSKRSAMA
jgi:DNA-binding response OmpR family regulator